MANPNLKENKLKRALALCLKYPVKLLSKREYVKLQYRHITHHKLNLDSPTRYTEKLQKLRLDVYPKDDLVSICASRDGARWYVDSLGFSKYLIPICGVYDRFEDIDFASLPDSFALKATHASGFNIIAKDKSKLDLEDAKKKFAKWLRTDYGKKTVEPHYSKIKPRIIVERLLEEPGEPSPIEYKLHVYNGKAHNLYAVIGRGEDIRYSELYADFTPFDGSQFNGWKKPDVAPKKPDNWDEMVRFAEACCAPFPFVRFDMYCIEGRIYFSEMTFTPAKGTLILDDDQADFEMGKWLDITNAKPHLVPAGIREKYLK